jgi:hypothetical protein
MDGSFCRYKWLVSTPAVTECHVRSSVGGWIGDEESRAVLPHIRDSSRRGGKFDLRTVWVIADAVSEPLVYYDELYVYVWLFLNVQSYRNISSHSCISYKVSDDRLL